MSKLVFAGASSELPNTGSTSNSPGIPGTQDVGGVLLAAVMTQDNQVHSCATAGWNLVGQYNGTGLTLSVWWAAAGAAAPTFTWTSSVANVAQVVYFRSEWDNPVAVTPVGTPGSASIGSSSTHTSTGVTGVGDQDVVILIDTTLSNAALTTPSGWTYVADQGGGPSFGNQHITFCSKLINAGSASGSTSSAGGSSNWVTIQLELIQDLAPANELQISALEVNAWLTGTAPPASGRRRQGAIVC